MQQYDYQTNLVCKCLKLSFTYKVQCILFDGGTLELLSVKENLVSQTYFWQSKIFYGCMFMKGVLNRFDLIIHENSYTYCMYMHVLLLKLKEL